MDTILRLKAGRLRSQYGPVTPGPGFLAGMVRLTGRVFERLMLWQERIEQRSALESLDDRMLKDIGLTRADIAFEADKPFWRP